VKPALDRIAAADRLLLLLDFDGTLAPIVPDPAEARLPERARAALEKISAKARDRIAVLSGRRLEDVRAKVSLPELIYAGNHGLEISGPGFERMHPGAEPLRDAVRALADELVRRLAGFPGVVVEGKDLSISVHYRNAAEECVPAIAEAVADAASAFPQLALSKGRKIFELRPPGGWNKGDAARWIRERVEGLPVAIGDDRTDEDMFAAVPDGVTIHAGPLPDTLAQSRLEGPSAVADFLDWLAATR
jgi:trehalose-phosphatase